MTLDRGPNNGGLGGYFEGYPDMEYYEPPSRAAVFMAGSAPAPGSTAAGATGSGSGKPLAQVLLDLMNELMTLMGTKVTAENQAARNTEIARLKDQMASAQEEIIALKAQMDAKSECLRAEAFRLDLEQQTIDAVHRMRHQSRLLAQYKARNLFNTPGIGGKAPLTVTRTADVPGSRAVVLHRQPDPPHRNH